MLNEKPRQKTLDQVIKSITSDLSPPYNVQIQKDASKTRAIIVLWQGNLILLWIACVFGSIFSGCIVMQCCPYYRWCIYVDTREHDTRKVDLVFGVSTNRFRNLVTCILTPICCSPKVNKEYERTFEAVTAAVRSGGVQVHTDTSQDSYQEVITSKRINDRKFLKYGLSAVLNEGEVEVV